MTYLPLGLSRGPRSGRLRCCEAWRECLSHLGHGRSPPRQCQRLAQSACDHSLLDSSAEGVTRRERCIDLSTRLCACDHNSMSGFASVPLAEVGTHADVISSIYYLRGCRHRGGFYEFGGCCVRIDLVRHTSKLKFILIVTFLSLFSARKMLTRSAHFARTACDSPVFTD